jgi:hypothetical protein
MEAHQFGAQKEQVRCFCFLLRNDGESDGAFGILEQSDSLLMSLTV